MCETKALLLKNYQKSNALSCRVQLSLRISIHDANDDDDDDDDDTHELTISHYNPTR